MWSSATPLSINTCLVVSLMILLRLLQALDESSAFSVVRVQRGCCGILAAHSAQLRERPNASTAARAVSWSQSTPHHHPTTHLHGPAGGVPSAQHRILVKVVAVTLG